ncbi:hypothetical protein MED121_11359 [Marinomonas sp. MED121]|nr:hypothetical protein MED121_11359 [Marinomonas sp. MED121]
MACITSLRDVGKNPKHVNTQQSMSQIRYSNVFHYDKKNFNTDYSAKLIWQAATY